MQGMEPKTSRVIEDKGATDKSNKYGEGNRGQMKAHTEDIEIPRR